MGETRTVRVRVEGKVQGVWYRGWAIDQARARGLSGWVRNRRDGSVEALFSGPAEIVAEMVEACRAGPPAARVSSVDAKPDIPPTESGFEQRPTE